MASRTAWCSRTAANWSSHLTVIGKSDMGPDGEFRTGTTVRFWPDPAVFDEIVFRAATLTERFQMMAFLNAGLRITFRDDRDDREGQAHEQVEYRYEGGIRDFVRHVNGTKEALFSEVGYFHQEEESGDSSMDVEIAFQWNTGYNTDGIHSFANGISTMEGRDARGRFQEVAHQHREPLRPGPAVPEGEGHQPPGRGHP